jgi:two-component system response regulator DctR
MTPLLLIVEDDVELGQSLEELFGAAGILRIRRFVSPHALLASLTEVYSESEQAGCLLLDIRLPDMTGAALFTHLQSLGFSWPVIFMTGHGDLSMAVDLMKAGAFDYVTKPFDPMGLIEKIKAAMTRSESQFFDLHFKRMQSEKLMSLTLHEREVFSRILKNKTTREIADFMGNSTRTIETHRANIFKKMAVNSALQMAQEHERFVLMGGETPFPMID